MITGTYFIFCPHCAGCWIIYGLSACLWPSGIHHICAESDRHSLGFTSLDFFASCDPLTLPFQAPLSPGLPSSSVTGRAWPAQRIPLILPCDDAGCRPQQEGLTTPAPTPFPATPTGGYRPLRGLQDGASLEVTSVDSPESSCSNKAAVNKLLPK